MYGLIATAIAALGAWALAYAGVSAAAWSAAVAVYLCGLFVTGGVGIAALAGVALPAAAVLAVLNITALRRRFVTRHLLPVFRRVLPPISDTEREALDAGDTWWETELFRGRPEWRDLLATRITALSGEERDFIDNQVETLCAMLDEDRIVREDRDLDPVAWDYLRRERFFSLIIPRRYGGRAFSSLAQSTVVAKIASRSLSAAVTVMVPNSLGPGELLMKYGTEAQKDYWLPRLADGREIPCFALTGPEAGSDAGAMPDRGIVCHGTHDGRETLGIRLSFSKRYITLAPVATVIGLAFKLHDPEGLLDGPDALGITCALIPADHPGVVIGDRHFPMGLAFQNGPIEGDDVFIPLDWIIGGPEMAGRGWRMLVECLAVGRAISLPALATAASTLAYRTTGAYARIRRQFRQPIGRFEGVQESLARIAGHTYTLEAARRLTASAGDLGVKPAVVSAIAKYHMTERMRLVINDAMDVHGGRAIIHGPRNYLAYAYQAIPVAITVEGANILTRSLMIFGQGAIRCHPYVLEEMTAASDDDLPAFDRALFRHVGYTINRGVRAFTLGLTGARVTGAPTGGPTARYYRELTRMSSALALVADVAMAVMGGALKRRERLSARLGDVLSELYLASAVLKYHHDAGSPPDELPYVAWSVEHSLANIHRAFDEYFDNLPNRGVALMLRWTVFPLGRPYRPPRDRLGARIAEAMMQPGGVRDRVTRFVYTGESDDDVTGRMERAFALLQEAEGPFERLETAVAHGEVAGDSFDARLADARERGLIEPAEAECLARYEHARREAIFTDAFAPGELAPRHHRAAARVRRGEDVA